MSGAPRQRDPHQLGSQDETSPGQSLPQGLIPTPKNRQKMGNKDSPSQFPFPFPASKTECPNLEFRVPAMIPSYRTLLGRQTRYLHESSLKNIL